MTVESWVKMRAEKVNESWMKMRLIRERKMNVRDDDEEVKIKEHEREATHAKYKSVKSWVKMRSEKVNEPWMKMKFSPWKEDERETMRR